MVLYNILFILGAFVLSALFGYMFVPRIVSFCRKRNLYDIPDGRKIHSNNIPRLGGTCFMPCMLVAAFVAMGLWTCVFGVSLLLVYVVGVVDDVVGVSARLKLLVQVIAACLLPASGLYINYLYGFMGIDFVPFYIGVPLTVFVIVFVVNAINLIDGIDGLAGSLSLVALLGFLYCFMREQMFAYSVLIAGLAGVVVAFLYYNILGGYRGKYKIFMGDSGSLTLGFVLAFLLVKLSMYNANVMPFSSDSLLLSYTLLIVPCFDVVRVVLERLRVGQPLFKADKRHLHHKLMRMGLSQHAALLAILGLQLVFIAINVILFKYVSLTWIVAIDVLVFIVFNFWADRKNAGR